MKNKTLCNYYGKALKNAEKEKDFSEEMNSRQRKITNQLCYSGSYDNVCWDPAQNYNLFTHSLSAFMHSRGKGSPRGRHKALRWGSCFCHVTRYREARAVTFWKEAISTFHHTNELPLALNPRRCWKSSWNGNCEKRVTRSSSFRRIQLASGSSS